MNQVSPRELKEWMENRKDFLLVDVREAWERDEFNIGGVHIPMDEIIGYINELPRDKDVVLYCEKGIRSVITVQRLETYGFTNLYNLVGGMYSWKNEI